MNQNRNWTFLRTIVFVYAAMIGIETGAASFTHVVVFPAWAASAEAARGWIPTMPYYMEEGDFFMYASSITMLSAMIALFAGWRSPNPMRKFLKASTICFIIVFIWSMLYFVPIQDSTMKGVAGAGLSDEELESKLLMFLNLNYLRLAMLYFSVGTALYALSLSHLLKPLNKV